MYKRLERKVAEYPGIAKSERQRKGTKDLAMILYFFVQGDEVKRVKETFECPSGNKTRKRAIEILSAKNPNYIVAFHKCFYAKTRIVFEKGDRTLSKKWKK
jgi:hypothetical protein